MAAKFLQFIDADNDAATYPVSNLRAMTCAGDTALLIKFNSSIGGSTGAEHDSVALTIASNSEKAVMKSIGDAIAFGKEAVVVVADDLTSDYINTNISGCDITLDT